MAITKIGDTISRLRKIIKANTKDAMVTDRYLFSIVLKHARLIIKNEDSSNRLMRISSLFEPLDNLELEEVDIVSSGIVSSGSFIKRTKHKIPSMFDGYFGPLIRRVSSIDQSMEVIMTTPARYAKISRSKNFKFDKNRYGWFFDNRLYFPNMDWDVVRMEGLFEEDTTLIGCSDQDKQCIPKHQQNFNVPGHILARAEELALNELGYSLNIPSDPKLDKQNIHRS